MLQAAAGLLPAEDVRHRDSPYLREGPQWEARIGPGSVQMRTRNYSRAEQRAERYEEGRRRMVDILAADPELAERERERRKASQGTKIYGWSRKSRNELRHKIGKLDLTPLMSDGRVLDVLTLTYPGGSADDPWFDAYWLLVAPDGPAVKRALARFRKRWERAWGPVFAVMKMEFQMRGAPHVHLMAGLPNPWARDEAGRTFREWLGPTWAECVWHEILAPLLGKRWAGTRTSVEQMSALETVMPGAGGAYLRHATYGTRVGTRERRGRITDPKRAAEYFLKEGIASSKAYQDNPPAQWVENGAGTGRIWQVWGLKEDTVTIAMTPADGIAFGRLMRRWYRAQLAVAYQRPRHAGGGRRFRPLFTNNRGRVLVNDGAAFTAQVARWLASRDAVGSPNPPAGVLPPHPLRQIEERRSRVGLHA
jgi:hypothetical protein